MATGRWPARVGKSVVAAVAPVLTEPTTVIVGRPRR